METIEERPTAEPTRATTKKPAALAGAAVEALTGTLAVVLSILGLTGRFVVPLAAVAVIATGAALVLEALAMTARERTGDVAEYERERRRVLEGSIGVDSIAGLAAISLGILSLVGFDSVTLLPAGVILLGGGMLLSAGGPTAEREGGRTRAARVAGGGLFAASSLHVVVGTAALVLGVVALLGHSPLVMTLIATLLVGAAQLLTPVTIGGRMSTTFAA